MSVKSSNASMCVFAVELTMIACFFGARPVRAQTTWTVKVSPKTGGGLDYWYCQDGNCPSKPSTGDLTVADGDTIKWVADTGHKNHLVVYFPHFTPFTDYDTHGYHGKDGNPLGGEVAHFDLYASSDGHNATYDYNVVLCDQGSTYPDPSDPKIVVAGGIGAFENSIERAETAMSRVQQYLENALAQIPTLRPEQQKQAHKALTEEIHGLKPLQDKLTALELRLQLGTKAVPQQGKQESPH